MTTDIKNADLARFCAENEVFSMTVVGTRGYKVTHSAKINPVPAQEPVQQSKPILAPIVEQEQAVKQAVCCHCGVEHPETEPCKICAAMDRLRESIRTRHNARLDCIAMNGCKSEGATRSPYKD